LRGLSQHLGQHQRGAGGVVQMVEQVSVGQSGC
jgi:hypothetical protein